MVTLEQAKTKFAEIVAKNGSGYQIADVWELSLSDPIYVMMLIDENGNQLFPGEVFPSIRKSDGVLVDFKYPCPA